MTIQENWESFIGSALGSPERRYDFDKIFIGSI